MTTKRVLIVFGTRPEAIKMAPLVRAFSEDRDFDLRVCVTAQHRQMLDQVLELFEIKPDYDLDIMTPGQTINDVTSGILQGIRKVLQDCEPDLVLVHGDTATTFATSLAAYYEKINVAHVEAGLRTGDLHAPWPEEANRKLTAVLTKYHFAPTVKAKQNLIDEGYSEEQIFVTGNTVIDALLLTKNKITNDASLKAVLDEKFSFLDKNKRLILITGHRRESFGGGFERLCQAIAELAKEHDDVEFLFPVHLNPNVSVPVHEALGSVRNVFLIEPQQYQEFIYLMDRSYLLITDSGGIQEEAPSLGKPVLVTRDKTERPESIESGTVKLVGTDVAKVKKEVKQLLESESAYNKMSLANNPYGDGTASQKIIAELKG